MRILEEYVVPPNSGRASVVPRGRYIRIAGRTTVDFVAFNLINPRERFDQARTKTNQNTIYVTAGHVLYTQLNNVLLTIVEDTYAGGSRQHNLEKGMCSRKRHRLAFEHGLMQASYLRAFAPEDLPDHGCWENLSEAVRPWGILPEDLPAPFNIFQTLEIDPVSGRMTNTAIRPQDGAHVTMRAEMDCLAALSACPDITVGGQEIRVSILEDTAVAGAADAGRPARGESPHEGAPRWNEPWGPRWNPQEARRGPEDVMGTPSVSPPSTGSNRTAMCWSGSWTTPSIRN